MGRKETRENAMKLLYQVQIQKDDIQEQISRFIEEQEITRPQDKEYLLNVVNGVIENAEELDNLISKHAKGWTIHRMPKVDLAIMRLSCFEIKYRNDIPVNVSINEAVELAKKYSSEQSKTFVNGVLGKIFAELADYTADDSGE
ncbi:MAG TPA: transcription antitermination factor NusB [Clostridiaceae bacterium]|nr:transcription antitermination factor NusB [Clostridiaceae bacterium]